MSNLLDSLSFRLVSLEDFESPQLARRILDAIFNCPNILRPKKFGHYAPLVNKIGSSFEPIVNCWTEGMPGILPHIKKEGVIILEYCPNGYYMSMWSKSNPPDFSHITGGIPTKHFKQNPELLDKLLDVFFSLVDIVKPVYACVNNASFRGWDAPLNLGLRLPEIPWLSVYGQPYIEMFGKDLIKSAPFYKIDEHEDGTFGLQATESVFDPIPRDLKAEIRKHLGEDAFMAGTRWKYKDGRAPNFDFFKGHAPSFSLLMAARFDD